MSTAVIPIREQTRAVVRALLAQTAMEQFAAHGYAETTVDDVAAAAGVSRRTLFNYFGSKEELALSGLAEQGTAIAERLAERPVEEDLWLSIRASMSVLDEIETTAQRRLELVTLLFNNESLRAAHAEKQAGWQTLLAPLIEARLPDSEHRHLEARAIAATAITCLETASEEWARLRGQVDLFDLYDVAIEAVRAPCVRSRTQ